VRAWQFHEFGPITNLRLEEIPEPIPGAGEVLVALRYAALNPADRYMVAGQYPRPAPRPFSVGRDGAGVIARALPDGRFAEGDPVLILGGGLGVSRPGTLAEYVAVPEVWLAPLPEGWDFKDGAASPLVSLTAWQALAIRGELTAGQRVLITGASGGVGMAATRLATALGAEVVALSRSEERREKLKDIGASVVLDGSLDGLVGRVKDALGGGRTDLALDTLGGPYLDACTRIVRYGGRLMVVGLLADATASLSLGLLIHKCLQVHGLSVSAYHAEEAQRAWTAIVPLLNQVDPIPVGGCFPFESVLEAFELLARGGAGKICVKITCVN